MVCGKRDCRRNAYIIVSENALIMDRRAGVGNTSANIK